VPGPIGFTLPNFKRHLDVDHLVVACEWLADIELIDKASTPVKLTKRSQVEVPEMAFFRSLQD